ncbi:hypothetical protein BC937DRAFT_89442, partial [Endogone sp. FLAS-F59071]
MLTEDLELVTHVRDAISSQYRKLFSKRRDALRGFVDVFTISSHVTI